jgi:aldose sugar dehydrogenase
MLGVAFHLGTGQPFASEHGPDHIDEVTMLTAGVSGGWDPALTKGVLCPSDYCGYTSNKPDGTPTAMTDLSRFPDALKPSWNNRGVSEGMGPCVFLEGPHWKAWEGRLAVGFFRGARIELLQMDAIGMTTKATTVPRSAGATYTLACFGSGRSTLCCHRRWRNLATRKRRKIRRE